jgi:PmbA protein
MEKLLEMAKRAADQAEVYSIGYSSSSVSFNDAKLHDIETNFLSGVSLRIIKNGRLGFAYTRNLTDRQELLDNALCSLDGGVEAPYDLPDAGKTGEIDTCDPAVKNLTGADLLEEAKRVCTVLKSRSDGEITAVSFANQESLRILNSRGADISRKSSSAGTYGDIIYPGSGSGIGRYHLAKGFTQMPDFLMDEMTDLFGKGRETVRADGGKMQVLFMPGSMITLLWRIISGLSGRSLYEKITPAAEKLGQRIFSQKLTITDDPLNDGYPGARSFDDEGVPCRPLTLVDRGVLKGFYYDLKYADKMGVSSTGHGYRSGPWGGDPLTAKPGPFPSHLFIKPGAASLARLIAMMDRGIIVEGALGAHSGNIPNGDYSIGVSPGLYVEKGQIAGRIKDAMVTGNIYQTLDSVVELGDTLSPSFAGAWVPPLLCDGVSVTTRS